MDTYMFLCDSSFIILYGKVTTEVIKPQTALLKAVRNSKNLLVFEEIL